MRWIAVLATAAALLPGLSHAEPAGEVSLEHGRYMTLVGGCNDCHTAGYAQAGGSSPQSDWLKGNPVGFRGPWGTSYAVNLRAYMAPISEDAWVTLAHSMQTKPPMPWFNLHAMNEPDLRSMYRFVKSLGPVGDPSPVALPPGQEPKTPYVVAAPPTMPH